MSFKSILKKFLPASSAKTDARFTALSSQLKQQDQQIAALASHLKQQDQQIAALASHLERQNTQLSELTQTASSLAHRNELMAKHLKIGVGQAREAVWSDVYHDTINGSAWLNDKKFSPGRWAVGYQYMYVMYRVLDEFRPQSVLDLGLGQSSHLIGQYVQSDPTAHHTVVEQNPEWISFYSGTHPLAPNLEILQMDYCLEPYQDAQDVRCFSGFAEKLAGRKFDLISIDAPHSGDMKQFARVDILKILPNCLADRFVIVLDDAERQPERNTANEITRILKENGIKFKSYNYTGIKTCSVWASEGWEFLCTL